MGQSPESEKPKATLGFRALTPIFLFSSKPASATDPACRSE
jgi:hypothetical protein